MNTPSSSDFYIRFWGVRGTMPMADAQFLRYGGNTSCVEVVCGGQTLILDAGTGIQKLGAQLQGKHVDLLLSHTHIDHVCGLPFFSPAYKEGQRIDIWAGHLVPEYDLRQVFGHLMSSPLFPITPDQFKADIHYHDFSAGDDIQPSRLLDAGIRIRTLALNHPDRATGYRIEYKGRSLCYITDIEHTPGMFNKALAEFVANASCLIYDATYDDTDFSRYQGWGHSTWQQAARLAQHAHVKTLVAFHHDPEADDTALDKRQQAISQMHADAHIASEQKVIFI